MKPVIAGPESASAGQVIHHDPRGDGSVQGFRAAAHRQAEMVCGNGFHFVGNAVSLITDDKHKGRRNFVPFIEWFAV